MMRKVAQFILAWAVLVILSLAAALTGGCIVDKLLTIELSEPSAPAARSSVLTTRPAHRPVDVRDSVLDAIGGGLAPGIRGDR